MLFIKGLLIFAAASISVDDAPKRTPPQKIEKIVSLLRVKSMCPEGSINVVLHTPDQDEVIVSYGVIPETKQKFFIIRYVSPVYTATAIAHDEDQNVQKVSSNIVSTIPTIYLDFDANGVLDEQRELFEEEYQHLAELSSDPGDAQKSYLDMVDQILEHLEKGLQRS